MKKTLKATGAILICCVLMVMVVIYTPKLTPESTKGRETLEEHLQHLALTREAHTLTREALRKTHEAIRKVLEATRSSAKKVQFNDKGEPYLETADLNPLVEASTEAIKGLTEANEAVKQRNEALQRLNEEDTHLKSLIEANIKANTELIAALTEVNAQMKALVELLQHFNKENTRPETIRKVYNAITEGLSVIISKAVTVQDEAHKANHEYQMARINKL